MTNMREETEGYLRNSFIANPPIKREEFFKIIDKCKSEFDSFIDDTESPELVFALSTVLKDYFSDIQRFIVDDAMPRLAAEIPSHGLVH